MAKPPTRLAGEEDVRSGEPLWRPTATAAALSARAGILRQIREFFHERGALEVETPALSQAGTPDVNLRHLKVLLGAEAPGMPATGYLHTSPEYAMKRLLAAGFGPIYQICKVFRGEESGRLHNPEFTMLEWYRPDTDLYAFMDEVEALLERVLKCGPCERRAYAHAFSEHVGLDPHSASTVQLRRRARDLGLDLSRGTRLDRGGLLDFLFSHCVGPRLGHDEPCFLFDWPAGQAALARVKPGPPPVAERFELFVRGIELANGYQELVHPVEHSLRFELEKSRRRQLRLPEVPVDERFLAAVNHGLPECSGVALGVDRLVMVALGASRLEDIIAFPADIA